MNEKQRARERRLAVWDRILQHPERIGPFLRDVQEDIFKAHRAVEEAKRLPPLKPLAPSDLLERLLELRRNYKGEES